MATKMKAKIKKLWLKALRSGEYKKTTGRLRRPQSDNEPGGYCCLGVLCELHRKATKKAGWVVNGDNLSYRGKSGELPESVRKWAGLPDSDPTVANHALSARNDDLHETFPEIAAVISKNL